MTFIDLLKDCADKNLTIRAEFVGHVPERGKILSVDEDSILWKPLDAPSIPETVPVDKLCRVRVIQDEPKA